MYSISSVPGSKQECLLNLIYPFQWIWQKHSLMLKHHSTYLLPGFSFVQWKTALCQLWVQVLMDGWSEAGILTQVCVIGFAELLLSTEAELELRFVQPAQGVSILKGSEGITSVAVGDKAKIVPGSGTKKKWSMKYTKDISQKHYDKLYKFTNVINTIEALLFFYGLWCPKSIVLFLFKPVYFCLI